MNYLNFEIIELFMKKKKSNFFFEKFELAIYEKKKKKNLKFFFNFFFLNLNYLWTNEPVIFNKFYTDTKIFYVSAVHFFFK